MTSAPRLAPSPAARTGFSSRVRLPDGSGGELGGWAGSSAAAMAAILAVKRLPVSTLPRLPGTGELWRSSHSAPERPRARAPRRLAFSLARSGRVSHGSNCR